MPADDPDPAQMLTPLGRLLRDRMADNEWQLPDVCRPPDGKLKGGPARSTISWHMQPGHWLKTMPRPETRKQLAKAVRVDVADITEAAWNSMESNRGDTDVAHRNSGPEGEIDRHPVGYDLNAELDGLSDEEVESVLAVVRAMKRAKGR